MSNIFTGIKDFVKCIFVQDESVGLKGLEKAKSSNEFFLPKRIADYKLSDIMKL